MVEIEPNSNISIVQLYKEDILDLLCPVSQRQPLSIREEMNGEIKVKSQNNA